MNRKEISELRRRLSPDKNAIGHIYGCYVNTKKEIIAYLDESLAAMPPEEAEKYLGLLKKALSGTQGKNLIDIVFSTRQVADSPEHKLLMSLRETELKDPAVRRRFTTRSSNRWTWTTAITWCCWPTTPTTCPLRPRTA